ncbi:chloride channel protein [Exercitatus varius]|uniref:chloride channel protein n=1 Tax=Exercitatus varius TaxID=67857 RepID=UPI00294B3DD1|nr:chloride channel protein [Exercitatus varius]MDG2952124.1 chloride channel protein [Exercitatus varius]
MQHHSSIRARFRYVLHKKLRQTHRISYKTIELSCLLIGAALVALFSLGFAKLADLGLQWNAQWASRYPVAVWFVLPLGMAALAWFTPRYTPYVAGSGIPQVIASLSLQHGPQKSRLIAFWQTLWKIPLTFLAMLIGASVGREGPSVQVGAAVMLAWGNLCRRYGMAFTGLNANELMAAGAGGGLAAAFNAPLAGVIFALEELGRGILLRWERRVLFGVFAAGVILVVIEGNSPYFPQYQGATLVNNMLLWVLLCGVVCGVFGGIFARLLAKGVAGVSPTLLRGWVRRHPIIVALFLGIVLAALGTYTNGQTYGTGYYVVANALAGEAIEPESVGIAKLFATVATYWTGIAGGIFTPSLTIGAGIGAHISAFTQGLIDPRLLVLLCMVGFLAGATQSPLTAAVIVMEMTGSQPVLVWSLIGGLIASFVSRQIMPKPFYHFAAMRFRQRIIEESKSAG